MIPEKGTESQPLDAYRGVRPRGMSEIVSVVSSRVSPERARGFERIAASALLLPGHEGVLA